MSVARTISFPEGSAIIATGPELRKHEAWSSAFHAQCKDHRYYEIIEETLDNDFEYQYLVLRDRPGVIRGIQPFFFLRQNLIEGIPGAFRGMVDSIRRAWPKFLTSRVLMVGCAAGEGHLGPLNSDLARKRACGEGVAHRAEGFFANISRGLLSLFAEWFCPSPQHANDAAPPQLR